MMPDISFSSWEIPRRSLTMQNPCLSPRILPGPLPPAFWVHHSSETTFVMVTMTAMLSKPVVNFLSSPDSMSSQHWAQLTSPSSVKNAPPKLLQQHTLLFSTRSQTLRLRLLSWPLPVLSLALTLEHAPAGPLAIDPLSGCHLTTSHDFPLVASMYAASTRPQ